jgi:hypothetical protein
MKNKVLLAFVALFCTPLVMARNKAAYPSENVARFVVDKLDVASLPSAFRPKKEKGKKTFADYGFQTQIVDENNALLTASGGGKSLTIKVLDHNSGGIYVCLAESKQDEDTGKSQSVIRLKWKDRDALLEAHATFREFAACPVVDADDSAANSY